MTAAAETNALTFFAWGDTHFGYEQQFGPRDIRWQAMRQMATLAGWPYPAEVGGCIETPALVLHCGDFFDGGPRELAMYLH